MKFNRFHEYLTAQMGEEGAGSLPIRVEWEDYNADGKFIGFGSDNSSFIGNASQLMIIPYGGDDDGTVRKISGIQFYNSDVQNTRTIRFNLARRNAGTTRLPGFSLVTGASLLYSTERGWQLLAP